MKNLFIILLMFGATMLSFMSCKEEDVVRDPIVEDTTDVEDYKADYIFKYEILLPLDTVNYRNVAVVTDSLKIATELGYSSTAELKLALGTVTAGVQSDQTAEFFAINGSTFYDNHEVMTAQNFGHWFAANGDVINWGETAFLYSEFNTVDWTFFIGQYPKHLKTGEKYTIIQMIENDDKRVAFEFHVTVGEYYVEVVPELEIVATHNLELSEVPDNDYAATDITIDMTAVATELGTTLEDLLANSKLYGINADGTKTSTYTADAGYFFTNDGNVTNWGADGCTLFVNYSDAGIFSVGQFPAAAVVDEVYTFRVGIAYKDLKMVQYNIALTIIGYVDPETAPEGDPVTVEETYEVDQVYSADWSVNNRIDVKEVLRNAFKMTTYQIHTAINDSSLVFSGLNADGSVYMVDGVIASTANAPGHWYAATGDVTQYTSETAVPAIYSELAHTNETLEFSIGHHPDNTKAGDIVTYKQVAELNGGKVTFTFTVKIQ